MEAMESSLKYKELYKELAQALTELKISVCDHDLGGGYCFQTKSIRAFIVIDSKMNFKEKYFTLCHETGHLFYIRDKNEFVWSDYPRSEEEAHKFAIQMLKSNDIDSLEYYRFYGKVTKKVTKRRKSWFEI